MRSDCLYLEDIVEAADAIAVFLEGRSQESFVSDDMLRSAVLQKLAIIGECATRLRPQVRAAHAHVPWADIIGFRNIAVHAYFSVQWPIVWVTATEDVPALRRQISTILEQLDDSIS